MQSSNINVINRLQLLQRRHEAVKINNNQHDIRYQEQERCSQPDSQIYEVVLFYCPCFIFTVVMALLLLYFTFKKYAPSRLFNNKIVVFSLVTLTGQNAMLGLSMRYARWVLISWQYCVLIGCHCFRTRPGDMFISTTAVFCAELVKLITCLGLVWNDEDRSVGKWWSALDRTIIKQPMDTLKVSKRDHFCSLKVRSQV